MKKEIHPTYNTVEVKCACGNNFKVGSTMKEVNVEVCNLCHPFYTGKEKSVDAAGRVDKFNKKREFAAKSKKK